MQKYGNIRFYPEMKGPSYNWCWSEAVAKICCGGMSQTSGTGKGIFFLWLLFGWMCTWLQQSRLPLNSYCFWNSKPFLFWVTSKEFKHAVQYFFFLNLVLNCTTPWLHKIAIVVSCCNDFFQVNGKHFFLCFCSAFLGLLMAFFNFMFSGPLWYAIHGTTSMHTWYTCKQKTC